MDRISATIITRNEEAQIERCLESLKGVVDEIIVVDSYSIDRTTEICRRYGCKITARAFTGYGIQRQYAVGLTTFPYLLSIDADEVLSPELREAIIAMQNEGFKDNIYSLKIINYYCGRPVMHSGWKPVTQVRLFNKRYANWNLVDLAERVTFPNSLMPKVLPGYINHYRCNSSKELVNKEMRHSVIYGRILASQSRRISPVTPVLRASMTFMRCHIFDGALLDGSCGMEIAKNKFMTTLNSYRVARGIIKKRKS